MLVFTPYVTWTVITESPLADVRVLNPNFIPPKLFLPEIDSDGNNDDSNEPLDFFSKEGIGNYFCSFKNFCLGLKGSA